LAYHIKNGNYGKTVLDGLNVLFLSYFKGNIWDGNTKSNNASAEVKALSGPMTPPGKLVQTINPPGSEVRPGAVATWGMVVTDTVDAMPYKWERKGNSSKHIPFDWSGP
jgi:hypothetical protein